MTTVVFSNFFFQKIRMRKDVSCYKLKKKKHTTGTIRKSNIKIVERSKIDTPNKYLTIHFPGLEQALQ